MASLRFSTYSVMSPTNNEFYFLFSISNSFYFCYLTVVARTSDTVLNKKWGEQVSLFCSLPQRKCFQLFVIEYGVRYRLIIYGLYYVEVCSIYTPFWKDFIINGCWILWKSFFCTYWDNYSSVCWYDVSYWLICGYWTILVLNPWAKSQWIMVYDHFNIWLDLVC